MRKLREVHRVYGVWGVILLFVYKLGIFRMREFKSALEILEWAGKNGVLLIKDRGFVKLDGLPLFPDRSFLFRPFSSDALVIRQHFFEFELKPVIAYFEQKGIKPRLMIDAGANIGASACILHWHFPRLRSLLIEASPSNAHLARLNSSSSDSIVWEKALWWRNEFLKFDTSSSEWGMKVIGPESRKGIRVEATKLSDILSSADFANPDYIKIDIEGAEEEIFEKDQKLETLIHSVSCISVEPHSEEGTQLVERKLSSWGFRVEYHGELIIGFR